MLKSLNLLTFLLWPLLFFCQVKETLPPDYINTIEFKGKEEFSGTPIVKLGQSLTLKFDDLVGDEADYYYKISYYDFDWKPTQLSRNEFMKGFDNIRIKNYKNSLNTLQVYTHYELNLPNKETKALKKSGNYLLEIYNDNDEIVFSKRFIVYEDIASVTAEVKRSRDLKYINAKQVLNFSVSGGSNLQFKNPNKNIKTLLIKNNDLQNSIYNLKPQHHEGEKLVYRYDQEAAFMAGNEFLNFDSKDIHTSTANIEHIALDNIYNVYLYPDAVRADDLYTYNPDINGNFKINTLQGEDADIESEYVWVHFYLDYNKPIKNGELHIYGGFNNYNLDESTLMTYNSEDDHYEGRLLLKQGFYNYLYVLKQKNGAIDQGFISGNFDKTENQYTVLAYYRAPGGRYDRIVGVGKANSQNISD